ncbi:coiled-coil-helix-coiled-coil-helix domain-containing protein 1 [Monomorium pharaonis]|uniref:coiled-coil-helix-coiled-coil-helix domain-containing protein 1 n=1 Tax=Monomorium pharaonis TaxID=307658 RepID=UPI00063F178A|nr:coiled-coil-helix-coiled-coil-helix domain-containing protein 1 [Monomorium pharaonis]XP_012537632.1 coiled-coil-helix-coiled-coil-helix domain-containing protein 1 [Monomorium pharaonis]XP_012537634.1 coiled-coil-helix-coiled-coil-helix domain-containing protein 1 [Monomorium pharaonis]
MRLTSILCRNARQPQNEKKVPFKALLPLKLRDFVSGKNQMTTESRGCLYEMTLLLSCLEENEFEDKRCVPQLNALNQCFKVYSDNMQRARSIKEQTVPVPNSKNLTHKQITYLLRRYPVV